MKIKFAAHEFLLVDATTAFDFTNDARNFVSFVGFGIVPGIREARYETPGAPRLGSRRRITKTDGTDHLEEITAFEKPTLHVSRISGLTAPLSWLVRSAEDAWRFSPASSGTRIDRVFAFELTSPLVAPIAFPLMHIFMRIAIRRDLRNVSNALRQRSASAA
ncbi:MAG: SRPBCC family protein [Gemmatimonadaceae bacterium]